MYGFLGALWRTVVPESIRQPLYLKRRYGAAESRPGLSRDSLDGLFSFYRDHSPPVAPVIVPNRLRLEVDLRDHGVAHPLFFQQDYETPERNFYANYLKPGQTVVDVGANIGYLTTLAAQLIGPSGRVIAFEPDFWNFTLLMGNCRRNHFSNVTLKNVALGERNGDVTLFTCTDNFGDHRVGYLQTDRTGKRVPMLTGDEALQGVGPIHLLKLDVQGYEPFVLKGLSKTLRTNPPRVILMEFWPHGTKAANGDLDVTLNDILAQGYTQHLLDDAGATRPVSSMELRAAIPKNVPELSQYVNVILRHSA